MYLLWDTLFFLYLWKVQLYQIPFIRCFQSGGSERVVPKPGNLLETHVFWPHARPETETLGIGHSNVYFNKPSRWFLSIVMFGNHCSRAFPFKLCLYTFLVHSSYHFVTPSSTSPRQCHLPCWQSFMHIQGLHFNCQIILIWVTSVFRGQNTQCPSLRVPWHHLLNNQDTSGHTLNFTIIWKCSTSEILKS